jgi:DNA-binding XRE family transcriptional regulator
LSRAKLAFLSGVSPRTIVRLEQGAEVMPLLRKAVLAALEGAVVGGACVRPAAE